ncbi:MAG: hypothetical protein HN341_00230 [Verrucomicrobia bacterium]|jgi:hypothetical protein|nr:hypothetical protein [Verrucomicrobiota bacterium]
MAEEQELTPEEKLLEVIQKGEAPQGDATTGSAGLTLGDESDGQLVSRVALGGALPAGLSTARHLLVVVVVLLLGASGYEIYSNLPEPGKAYPEVELNLPSRPGTLAMASLSDTLDMFSRHRILGKVPKPYHRPQTGPGSEEWKGWRLLVRDNWKFMGTSEVQQTTESGDVETVREAIVMDTKEKKMHFLTTGQTIILTKQEVRVDSIDETKVKLVSGEETLTIE